MSSPVPGSRFVVGNEVRLHYLDWGGDGPALVFLAGMGCSVYIFGAIAPRFAERFHVLGLDRRGHGDSDYPDTGYDPDTLADDLRRFLDQLHIERAILAGHSMACVELTHLAALHPERVLALVFLDAAYDASLPDYKAAYQKNPIGKMIPAWPEEDPPGFGDYTALVKKHYPALASVWTDAMEEQIRHTVTTTPEGKVRDKMSDSISAAVNATLGSYSPAFSRIRAPVLSFFSIRDGSDFLSSEYMSEEQQAEVLRFFSVVLGPVQRAQIEAFKRQLPLATVVELPNGHHYCFIRHEEVVVREMMAFLLREVPSERPSGHS